jgi:hypothetical protein
VQVQVDDVNAHVAGPRDADERVHVRTVHVDESARVVDDAANLLNVALEDATRVRVREHQSRHVARRAQFAQVCEVGQAFARRANRFDGEAGEVSGGRVRAVRRVGDEHHAARARALAVAAV